MIRYFYQRYYDSFGLRWIKMYIIMKFALFKYNPTYAVFKITKTRFEIYVRFLALSTKDQFTARIKQDMLDFNLLQ